MKPHSFAFLLSLPALAFAALPTATVEDGVLTGTTTLVAGATAPVNQFLGVPFADSPPVRFGMPQPVKSYGSKTVDKWQASCVQQFANAPGRPSRAEVMQLFNNPAPKESEDCLYLNIYAPSTPPPAGGRAVMFWIYGGGLTYGTASHPWYDGSFFAAYQDVILVAANYRTNVFGFPHSDEITNRSEWNIGFHDQRFALNWVHRNIEQFGGNSSKITIFGQSSGATSVDRLVSTMGTNPPFRAAIMQSGTSSVTPGGANESSTPWITLAKQVGCGDAPSRLQCVRNITDYMVIKNASEALYNYTKNGVTVSYNLAFAPIRDNLTEYADAESRRTGGLIAKVPILQGTTAEEARLYSLSYNFAGGLQFWAGSFIPSAYQSQVVSDYPIPSVYPNDDAAVGQAWTDYVYKCPASVVTQDSAAAGIDTWRYYFNASFNNYILSPAFINRGPYHTMEIPLVFGTYRDYTPDKNAAQEIALSQYMQTAWANFAKDPHSGPDPKWPKVGTGSANANIGVLGWSGNTFANLTVTSSTTTDSICSLYRPIYPQATTGNAW